MNPLHDPWESAAVILMVLAFFVMVLTDWRPA